MEPLNFGALAQIRVLLVPVGPIKRTVFEKLAADVRKHDSIRLGDIPADTREDKARFMPSPLASGHIHISYPSHPLPSSHAPLTLFRPSDFPLGVIGIATCSQNDLLPAIPSQFITALSDLFPDGSLFPLAKNCFVFEEADENPSSNLGNLPGLVVIPSVMGNKQLYVGTLMADLCSNILAEFATMVQTLETPLGNEYLNATLFPSLPSASELPKPLEMDGPLRSSLPPLPIQHSQPELQTASSLLRAKTPTSLTVKRNSSVGPGPLSSPYRQSSLPIQSGKKKQATIGAVSSHGRLFKVLGDLFLLAGRTMDASVWYNEATVMLKGPQDNVWHASALEGLATIPILEAWSAGQTSDLNNEKEPWADISDKLSQAISLYQRTTPPTESDSNYSLVTWLYTRAVLRHTSLLFNIWTSKGWGPVAFASLLQTGFSTASSTSIPDAELGARAYKRLSQNTSEKLTVITGITRGSIVNTLAQAHGPWLLHLGPRERIATLESVATIYSTLGYIRKEAYILREVLGCIMDLLVCGREESGTAKIAGAGLGIQGVDLGTESKQGSVGVRTNDRSDGNESILNVVQHICRVHGIDLGAVRMFSHTEQPSSGTNAALKEVSIDPDARPEPWGWPELQIGIVREAIAVAEALPDYPSVAQFSLSALKTLHLVMSTSDQNHLYHTAARALSTAKRRGDQRHVDYWSGQPITSIEVLPLPSTRIPIEKPLSLLSPGTSDIAPILLGMPDPFLYNPRRLAAGKAGILLVQKEPFEVVITLCNPFVFDLELSSLSLKTSGVSLESKALALIVPANSYHPVTVTLQALEAGSLEIQGCVVQAPGGEPKEFLLPLASEDEESRQARDLSAIGCEAGRSKRSGLEARPWEKQRARQSMTRKETLPRFLQCKVVSQQPLLRIRRTSLTHGAVMLYTGENSSIRLTLENVSSLPINFIHLTFEDSTIGPAQQALADGEMSEFDTYETEYELLHHPTFRWDSKRGSHDIAPGDQTVITVNCFGKVGCTHGTIHISYAHCQQSQDDPSNIFYTRQLSYPVLVTVYHMLECYNMDILPFSPDTSNPAPSAVERHMNSLSVRDSSEWCIFCIEVRNTYGIPFEVTFAYNQSDASGGGSPALVPPGSTTRIMLPIRKLRLSREDSTKPIPTLADRQFVVNKSHLSVYEENIQRELFWYRETLLTAVRGRWKEVGGARSGELSLRRQRMTLPMLDSLRIGDVSIQLSLWKYETEDDEASPIGHTGGTYTPPLNEFVYLRTTITNLCSSEIILTLDLDIEPTQHVLYEGVLSDIPIGRLQKGSSRDFETAISFVACGRFELQGTATILSGDEDTGSFDRQQYRGYLRAIVEP